MTLDFVCSYTEFFTGSFLQAQALSKPVSNSLDFHELLGDGVQIKSVLVKWTVVSGLHLFVIVIGWIVRGFKEINIPTNTTNIF